MSPPPALLVLSLIVAPALAFTNTFASFPLHARQSDDVSCADVGWKDCGQSCIPLDYTCCPDKQGGCETDGFTCWLGDNGQYGCCAEGRQCRGPGGVNTIDIGTTVTSDIVTSAEATGTTAGDDDVTTTTRASNTKTTTTAADAPLRPTQASSSSPEATATTRRNSDKVISLTSTPTATLTPDSNTSTTFTAARSAGGDAPGAASRRYANGGSVWQAVVAGLAAGLGMLL